MRSYTMQTSKKLRRATDTRVVWLNLAVEYSLRHLQDPGSGLPPLYSLPTSELRQWIRKRLFIEEIWRNEAIIYPRSRTLPKQFGNDPSVVRIITGGRWLLAGDKHSSIYYYDLDLENPEPVHLISPDARNPVPGDHQRVDLIDFFVEPGFPPSEFTIAFVGGGRYLFGCCRPKLTRAFNFRQWTQTATMDSYLAGQG